MKYLSNTLRMLGRLILLSIFIYYIFLMILITLQYIPIDYRAAFLETKQDIIHLTHYQLSFYSHVFSSIFVLIIGATQFSRYIRSTHPQVHRILGYIYTFGILCVSAPAGFIMGFYGFGGMSATISFLSLSLLWFFFTFQAFIKARAKNYFLHQKYMILSYSLTLSAISLRLIKQILHFYTDLARVDIYVIATWSGWIINLLIGLIIVLMLQKKIVKNSMAQ